MCEPSTTAMILTAIGTGTQATNQYISNRRQDRAAAAGIRRQSEIQQEGNQRVDNLIDEIAASTPAEEKAAALEGFMNTLRRNQDTTGGRDDPLLLGGERFAERTASGEAETQRRGEETADQLARIGAPARQREGELASTADVAGALRELGNRSSAEEFINRLRIASKRPNPAVDALGSTLKGIGSVIALQPAASGANLTKAFNAGTLIDAPIRGAGSTPFNVPTRMPA